MQEIEYRTNAMLFALGLVIAALGAGAVYVGTTGEYAFTWGGLSVGAWPLCIAGVMALAVGVAIAWAARKSPACTGCASQLKSVHRRVMRSRLSRIKSSIRADSPERLGEFSRVTTAESVTIYLNYCPECASVGQVWVSHPGEQAPPRLLTGPSVAGWRDALTA